MKTAVILFNLGGPDSLNAVKPFLFNLFYDPAIIRLRNPLRWLIAKIISGSREKAAKEIYAQIGNKSPILEQTRLQADALAEKLADQDDGSANEYKVFISMRYWHPFSNETIKQVKQYDPDQIVLLPLYPQFSSTTSGSSIKDWHQTATHYQLNKPVKTICCYPDAADFITAHANYVLEYFNKAIKSAGESKTPQILFSAHGLPEKTINSGDPYQYQIEYTVSKILEKIAEIEPEASRIINKNHVVCYQSRVGPVKWIGPYTDDEIVKAAKAKQPIVITPVAFVSEHSETLVELDIEYSKLARENGCNHYFRVPTLNVNEFFISALAKLILKCNNNSQAVCSGSDSSSRICPKAFNMCIMEG